MHKTVVITEAPQRTGAERETEGDAPRGAQPSPPREPPALGQAPLFTRDGPRASWPPPSSALTLRVAGGYLL